MARIFHAQSVIQLGTGLMTFAQLVLKLIIKEYPEEILIKLATVLKISKSS